MRCRTGKSIIILANHLLLFAERLPNCKHSRRKMRVLIQSVNHQKEQSICTNSNSCSQPTCVELGVALLCITLCETAIIIAWENNPPPPIIHMCLSPRLAIVAHAQYSKLNELKWCRWLHSRIHHDNDYFQLFC